MPIVQDEVKNRTWASGKRCGSTVCIGCKSRLFGVWLPATRRHAGLSIDSAWMRPPSAMRNRHTDAAIFRPAGTVFVSPVGLCVILSTAARESDTSADPVTVARTPCPASLEPGNHTRKISGTPRPTLSSVVFPPDVAEETMPGARPKRYVAMFHYQDPNRSPLEVSFRLTGISHDSNETTCLDVA
jgi:hypothetical protein